MEITKETKILYISPHLSTGGLPQYLWKKIESFNGVVEVYCVEYNFYGDLYVVQRNRIMNLLGDRFFCLGENKMELLEILKKVNPDFIHFEEIPETFIDSKILNEIYSPNRKYYICETCHSSTIEPSIKFYKPDKFIMVSRWIRDKFKVLDVPSEILEYPIENKEVRKIESQSFLGLDPSKKHILNVGLFTPGKNQSEMIEYARSLESFPVEFHFVGNQADNFSHYWKPLMNNLPSNCKVWGERNDVEIFYQASDLFLFTSKFELNPLCIKEALSYKLPSMFYNLDTYSGDYNNEDLVTFLTPDLEVNTFRILQLLGFVKKIQRNNDTSRVISLNL